MTAENRSRAFRNLQGYGVRIDGARITILDHAELERFAKPDRLIDDLTT